MYAEFSGVCALARASDGARTRSDTRSDVRSTGVGVWSKSVGVYGYIRGCMWGRTQLRNTTQHAQRRNVTNAET
jgi:hypothetical protein